MTYRQSKMYIDYVMRIMSIGIIKQSSGNRRKNSYLMIAYLDETKSCNKYCLRLNKY